MRPQKSLDQERMDRGGDKQGVALARNTMYLSGRETIQEESKGIQTPMIPRKGPV